MNDELIADLKQFIAATVSQATADMATKADLEKLATRAEMNGRFDKVDGRLDDLKLRIDTIADAHAEILEDHEKRLGRLEHHAA